MELQQAIAFVAKGVLPNEATMMFCRSFFCQGSRRWFTQWCAVAAVVLASACERKTPVHEDTSTGSNEAVKIDDVHVRPIESGISVHYRTSTSIRDCVAQAAEMPKVWDMIVKTRLGESAVERVVLFPEDVSGQSVSIEFSKSASGQWSAAVPCSIRISTNQDD